MMRLAILSSIHETDIILVPLYFFLKLGKSGKFYLQWRPTPAKPGRHWANSAPPTGPMGITAGCDTAWIQTRVSVVTPLALRRSALDRCATREPESNHPSGSISTSTKSVEARGSTSPLFWCPGYHTVNSVKWTRAEFHKLCMTVWEWSVAFRSSQYPSLFTDDRTYFTEVARHCKPRNCEIHNSIVKYSLWLPIERPNARVWLCLPGDGPAMTVPFPSLSVPH